MKKSKGILIVSLVFLVVFLSSMTGYIFGVNADDKGAKIPVQNLEEVKEEENTPTEQDITYGEPVTKKYILKQQEGKIVLFQRFSDGTEKIHKKYDISVSLLPSSDRELLKDGIEAESLSEALQMIEDYM